MISLYASLRKRRVPVLVLFSALVLVCGLVAQRISPDSSVAPFLPDSAGRSGQTARLLGESPLAGLVFVELTASDDDVLREQAEEIAKAIPPALASPVRLALQDTRPESVLAMLPSACDAAMLRALSAMDEQSMIRLLEEDKALLASLAGSLALPWVQADPLQLRTLLTSRLHVHPEGQATPAADAAGARTRPSLTSPWLFHADARHALLLLRPAAGTFSTQTATRLLDVLVAEQQRLAALCTDSSGTGTIRLLFSGGPLHTAVNARTIENDISRIAIVSLAGIALIYALLVRSLTVLWLVLIPAVATLAASAVTSLVWPSLSALALGFGASLMGLSEDYAAHMSMGLSSGHGAARIHGMLTKPLLVSCLLNVSGFLPLLLSGIPAVRQLALFSLVSLGSGCLMAVLILPLLPWSGRQLGAVRYCAPGTPRSPSATRALVCALVIACAIALLLPKVRTDFSPRAAGSDAYGLVAAAEDMRSRWSLAADTPLVLTGTDFENSLERAREAAQRLRAHGLVLSSPSDMLQPYAVREQNCALWRAWQEQEGAAFLARLDKAAAATGFTPAAFAPFRNFLQAEPVPVSVAFLEKHFAGLTQMAFFRMDRDCCTVLSLKRLPAEAASEADSGSGGGSEGGPEGRTAPALSELANILGPELADHAFLLSPAAMEQEIRTAFEGEMPLLVLTMVFCAAVLCLTQHKPLRILILAISPLASLLAVLAVFLVLGKTFTLTACIAVPIVVGLAVDHGIMVTHALESDRNLNIWKAVSLSTLTAFLSMGLLAFADHPALQNMGLVIFTGLAAELASALFLLPFLYPDRRS